MGEIIGIIVLILATAIPFALIIFGMAGGD